MLTKALVALAFLSIGVSAYGFFDAFSAAETPGAVGVHAARNGMLLMRLGAYGLVVVCNIGLVRWIGW